MSLRKFVQAILGGYGLGSSEKYLEESCLVKIANRFSFSVVLMWLLCTELVFVAVPLIKGFSTLLFILLIVAFIVMWESYMKLAVESVKYLLKMRSISRLRFLLLPLVIAVPAVYYVLSSMYII